MAKTIIFLCRCFGEIDSTVHISSLQEALREDTSIDFLHIIDSLCFPEDIKSAATRIRESGAQKIVIAACSPFGRGERIISGLTQEGFERKDIGLVDIREGCAWIHQESPGDATTKARDLITMEARSLAHRQRSKDAVIKVQKGVLITGAGPAGLAAARYLIKLGLPVHLVERGAYLGGMLTLISHVYPSGEEARRKLSALTREVETHPLVSFYPKAKVTSITGFAGNFQVTLRASESERKVRVGALIIASGARVYLPYGLYRYGELKNVITLMELERQFIKGTVEVKTAVFIQCVGARSPERPYCATICCPSSLKNAMRIRQINPEANVFILHRDVMTTGRTLEAYYRKALLSEVQFIRFDESRPPVIMGNDRAHTVKVFDAVHGRERIIDIDLVVLSTPLIPNEDNKKLADMLNLQLDRFGFFKERYPLHPLETRIDGVYLCGSSRWPVSSDQAITQGEAAAAKAASLLAREELSALSMSCTPYAKQGHATVNEHSCTGCGNCVSVCTFAACRLQYIDGRYISRVNKMRCKGCGNCVAVCPNGTIQLPENNYRAMGEMIRKAFGSS